MTRPSGEQDQARRAEPLPCPWCQKPLTITHPNVNPLGRCGTPDCFMYERQWALPIDDVKQVAAWNDRTPSPPSEAAQSPAPVPVESRAAFEAEMRRRGIDDLQWHERAKCYTPPSADLTWQGVQLALSWQAAAPAQSREGWVLVPREPTPTMLMDGQERVDMPFDEHGNGLNVDHTAADVYRIMLAAAPAAPTVQPEGLTEREQKAISAARDWIGAVPSRSAAVQTGDAHIALLLAIIDRLQQQRG
jgi:hypothetical protein